MCSTGLDYVEHRVGLCVAQGWIMCSTGLGYV